MSEVKLSVLILAAGKATRFKSEHSKMLHRLAGRPLGEYVLRTAMALHPAQTWMVIGHEAAEVRKAFERHIREINSGILCFERKKLLAHLDGLSDENAQKEFLLTDLVGILTRQREKVVAYPVADSRQVLGVNDRWELAGIERILRLR